MQFCFGTDGENFNECFEADTWQEAQEIAVALAINEMGSDDGDRIYLAKRVDVIPEDLIDADDVLELLANRAYDQAREHAEGWPEVSPEDVSKLQKRLEQCIKEWISETGNKPQFWSVDEIQELTIPPRFESPEPKGTF